MKYELGDVVVVDMGVFKGEFIIVDSNKFNNDVFYTLRPTNNQQKAILEAAIGGNTLNLEESEIKGLK